MSKCRNCNGFGYQFDNLIGYVNCDRCSPNRSVCGFCGGELDNFEQGYHADCARRLDEGAEVEIPKGVKRSDR